MRTWTLAVAGSVLMSVVSTGCTGMPTTREGADPGTTPTTSPTSSEGAASAQEPAAAAEVGTDEWQLTRPARSERIAAYATAVSGPAGTKVGLKVSTPAKAYRVSVYRIGAYDGGTAHLVDQLPWRPGRVQPEAVLDPVETRTVVAPWRRSAMLDTTGWEPGFHVIKLSTGRGWETLVPYVVSSETATGTVALVAPVTTWQAYNRWGGYSLYAGPGGNRSYAVSFDRPWILAPGANDYRTAAIPIVLRAERLGIPLSYFTNVDLHLQPSTLAGAHAYVSMGHDEYWTTTMRTAVLRARDAGTNLAVFGANTMYWRVRLDDTDTGPARRMVGYRHSASLDPMHDERPAEVTGRFRDAPVPRPEHALLGMQYECYPVDTDYVVATPGWWGFAGTGVSEGDHILGLVGPEADRVYPNARLPRPLQILSASSYPCGGVTTQAHSVYYTAPSGAAVFNAGTLRWGCALVDRCERPLGQRTATFTARVTDNVLRAFARGPAGIKRPAHDNVDDFGLSPVNAVPAS